MKDFKRPDNTALVIRMQPFGRLRIYLRKPRVKSFRAVLFRITLLLVPKCGI
jgi:hypothetical protein